MSGEIRTGRSEGDADLRAPRRRPSAARPLAPVRAGTPDDLREGDPPPALGGPKDRGGRSHLRSVRSGGITSDLGALVISVEATASARAQGAGTGRERLGVAGEVRRAEHEAIGSRPATVRATWRTWAAVSPPGAAKRLAGAMDGSWTSRSMWRCTASTSAAIRSTASARPGSPPGPMQVIADPVSAVRSASDGSRAPTRTTARSGTGQ
jgi:hypothetical protein